MIAYFDCFSGISGDMIVGAFLDAGVPFEWLESELKKLSLDRYSISVQDVKRGGFSGKRFRVEAEVEDEERNLSEIRGIINGSALSEPVRELSIKVFERLAQAEAKVHGVGVEEIHFHEVGAVDSIVDIVAASLCLSYLGVDEAYASEIPMSRGTVSCSHGLLPLPAPAVAELLKGVPVYQSLAKGEIVTPTGAAFLSVVCKGFGAFRPMTLKATGYGAGERESQGLPNMLRVTVGTSAEYNSELRTPDSELEVDSVTVIETNIDDMNPEVYGYVTERLLADGALDVSLTPVYMKKGRPGTVISVVCGDEDRDRLAELILRETSSIGVRFYKAERLKLPRESVEVKTRFGSIRMKVAKAGWGSKAQPEYDDCVRAAATSGVPVMDVYREAANQFERGIDEREL